MRSSILSYVIVLTWFISPSIYANAGKIDDTHYLQRKLDSIAIKGGVLHLENKVYNITSLDIPQSVSIQGTYSKAIKGGLKGTVFNCVGADTDNAVILNNGSSIQGCMFYYPNQSIVEGEVEHSYAATIRIAKGSLRNKIEDILFVNSYRCIDAMEHHESLTIVNCSGVALKSGIRIHNSTDIDRIRDVHFNANLLSNSNNFMPDDLVIQYGRYIRENSTAFEIYRADWLSLDGCFCYGFRNGLIIEGKDWHLKNPQNFTCLDILNCGFDACGCCIKANYINLLRISNCNCVSFYNNNRSPGTPRNYLTDDYAIQINGGGRTSIDNVNFWGIAHGFIYAFGESVQISRCRFTEGDTSHKGSYAIKLKKHVFTIEDCMFDFRGCSTLKGIKIEQGANALITGNVFRGVNSNIIEKSNDSKVSCPNNMLIECKDMSINF